MTAVPNLDALAARAAERMSNAIGEICEKTPKRPDGRRVKPEEADTLFTKALAMTQESGVYAACIFLQYRSGEEEKLERARAEELVASHALSALLRLLAEPALRGFSLGYGGPLEPEKMNRQKSDIRKHMARVAESGLEQALLVKQLWEQTLIYARYIARGQKKARALGENA